MLKLVYISRTGNIERFVEKTKINKESIISINEENKLNLINNKFLLIVYTDKFGEVPQICNDFLAKNGKNMVAVVGSGNRNWGENFAKASVLVSKKYNIPLLLRFELSGNNKDVVNFLNFWNELKNNY